MIDQEFLLSFLQKLLETPSPSGFTEQAISLCQQTANTAGFSTSRTRKGALLIELLPPQPESTVSRLVTAHVDTLGAMVRSFNDDGTLRFTSVGSFLMSSVEGEYCTVYPRQGEPLSGTLLSTEPSLHVYDEPEKLERIEKNMCIRLDARVDSPEDLQNLGLSVGDFIAFDPRTQITKEGFVKSRHLDDKASVAVLLATLDALQRHDLPCRHPTRFLLSNYEEVGHGATYLPPGITELIAVDMGAIGDDLCTNEYSVSLCAKDSSGPYDYHLTGQLIDLCQALSLPYAVDIYPHYGSDASAARRAGHDVPCALFGPGVHASHGMERTHLDALLATGRLLLAYLASETKF